MTANRYEFGNDLTIRVSESTTRPNLAGTRVTDVSIVGDLVHEGLHLDRPAPVVTTVGRFARFTSFQELHSGELTVLPAVSTLGASTRSSTAYAGFEPWGSTAPAYSGTETFTVTLLTEGYLDTPLGRFEDVLEFEWLSERSDSRPASETRRDRLWLARGVGPVQVDLPRLAPIGRVIRAVAQGRTVTPE